MSSLNSYGWLEVGDAAPGKPLDGTCRPNVGEPRSESTSAPTPASRRSRKNLHFAVTITQKLYFTSTNAPVFFWTRPNVEFFGPWKTSPPTAVFTESVQS